MRHDEGLLPVWSLTVDWTEGKFSFSERTVACPQRIKPSVRILRAGFLSFFHNFTLLPVPLRKLRSGTSFTPTGYFRSFFLLLNIWVKTDVSIWWFCSACTKKIITEWGVCGYWIFSILFFWYFFCCCLHLLIQLWLYYGNGILMNSWWCNRFISQLLVGI